MAEVARLLYESAFIAERYSGIRTFLEAPYVRHPAGPGPCEACAFCSLLEFVFKPGCGSWACLGVLWCTSP